MFPTLRKDDGFQATTPDLRDSVERLQRALIRVGYWLTADGLFGEGTQNAVEEFQRQAGLTVDGIAGPATWRTLSPYIRPSERPAPPPAEPVDGFENFRGDLAWLHAREGHAGKPYWPGGNSGITLDPGFDLGAQREHTLRRIYAGILSEIDIERLTPVLGFSGERARQELFRRRLRDSLRIGRRDALTIMPFIAVKYWHGITDRFTEVSNDDVPPAVQTVMLSLAYNRGISNPGLNMLAPHLSNQNWLQVANLVGNMQQNHRLPGIRRRRRMEADLIRDELDF